MPNSYKLYVDILITLVFCRTYLHREENWGSAEYRKIIMKIQKISTSLLECVQTDDVVGARRLLAGVDQRDRKSIVAKRDDCDPPLFVAALQGNVDMVEFLVKECHADTEERGRYENPDRDGHLVTPLWLAAVLNKLEVLNSLINLGADINAASYLGSTAVLAACSENVDVVKCLVKHGADVNRTNYYGKKLSHDGSSVEQGDLSDPHRKRCRSERTR